MTMLNLIQVTQSKIHGTGVYAKCNIKKGQHIIEYIGEKITKSESERRAEKQEQTGHVFIFELNKRYDIDGDVTYNDARFINHSCTPNCEAEIIDNHIWISAIKEIKEGKELTYNYGYGIDDYKDHLCRCGSSNCVGYILAEENWKKIKSY